VANTVKAVLTATINYDRMSWFISHPRHVALLSLDKALCDDISVLDGFKQAAN